MSSFTEREKEEIREFCRKEIDLLEAKCRGTVDQLGGEEHLADRIDLLVWVYSDRSDMEKYREVLRFVDGEENVDWEKVSWVLANIREEEHLHRYSAESIRRAIEQKIYTEERILEETEKADRVKIALDALTREAQRGQAEED